MFVGALGQDDRVTVLLLGDSNLARLYHGLPDLVPLAFGASVECRAVGGAWSGSLRDQIGDRTLSEYDAIVLSIGSSDNHPAFASSPALFRENVSRELERGGRWIALVPPGLARAPEPFDTAEVNALIRVYAGVLAELVLARGGIALDVRGVADRLGPAAFDADGMHLTRVAYQEMVPEIAGAIEASTQ
ncbi:SGNH/GDSL hydrolase family protein [Kribbella sp. NBC_00889]|uniref:SGNH/GDSL hydrolase family protein n=1 Tax=Kribbella sp. NBC_00889 TaxID=2975974 RepID=UPI00386A5DF2|nr:SGNH/GDSL hydrolase family protein [Kribbella sp. NBC_00889]